MRSMVENPRKPSPLLVHKGTILPVMGKSTTRDAALLRSDPQCTPSTT